MRSRPAAYLRNSLLIALAVGVIGAVSGCRIRDRGESTPDDDGGEELSAAEQEIVDDSTQLEESVRGGSGLAAIPTLAFAGRREPLTLARAVQRQAFAPLVFFPKGCASVETEGNVVTYTFDGCTGPLGLSNMSGREVVTFRPGPTAGSIEMTMASDGLSLDGRAFQHDAVAVLTIEDGGRRLAYAGSLSGTSPLGAPTEHVSDLVIATDEASLCATLDGTTSGTVGPRGLELAFAGFKRCAPIGTCPSGTITVSGRRRLVAVTVAFDGTDVATITTPRGGEIDFDLECTPLADAP